MRIMMRKGVHVPSWFQHMAMATDIPKGPQASLPFDVEVPFGEDEADTAGGATAAAAGTPAAAAGAAPEVVAQKALFTVRMRCDFQKQEEGELGCRTGMILEVIHIHSCNG